MSMFSEFQATNPTFTYADRDQLPEIAGQNMYFRTLMQPSSVGGIKVPDYSIDATTTKKIAVSHNLPVPTSATGETPEIMFVYCPHNLTWQILVFIRWANQGIPDWEYWKQIPATEDIGRNYQRARLVSGLMSVRSSAIATGGAPLQGTIDAVAYQNIPDISTFTGSVVPYSLDEKSLLVSSQLAYGAVALATPDSTENLQVCSGSTIVTGQIVNFTTSFVGQPAAPSGNPVARTYGPNQFGGLQLVASITCTVAAASATPTRLIITPYTDTFDEATQTVLRNNWRSWTMASFDPAQVTTQSESGVMLWDNSTNYKGPMTGYTVNSFGAAGTTFNAELVWGNMEDYVRGYINPGSLITVSNPAPNTLISISGAYNYECIPNANLSADVKITSGAAYINPEDLHVIKTLLARKGPEPRIKLIYTLDEYDKLVESDFFASVADRSILRKMAVSDAAGWMSLAKPLLKFAAKSLMPALMPGEFEAAGTTLGGRQRRPGVYLAAGDMDLEYEQKDELYKEKAKKQFGGLISENDSIYQRWKEREESKEERNRVLEAAEALMMLGSQPDLSFLDISREYELDELEYEELLDLILDVPTGEVVSASGEVDLKYTQIIRDDDYEAIEDEETDVAGPEVVNMRVGQIPDKPPVYTGDWAESAVARVTVGGMSKLLTGFEQPPLFPVITNQTADEVNALWLDYVRKNGVEKMAEIEATGLFKITGSNAVDGFAFFLRYIWFDAWTYGGKILGKLENGRITGSSPRAALASFFPVGASIGLKQDGDGLIKTTIANCCFTNAAAFARGRRFVTPVWASASGNKATIPATGAVHTVLGIYSTDWNVWQLNFERNLDTITVDISNPSLVYVMPISMNQAAYVCYKVRDFIVDANGEAMATETPFGDLFMTPRMPAQVRVVGRPGSAPSNRQRNVETRNAKQRKELVAAGESVAPVEVRELRRQPRLIQTRRPRKELSAAGAFAVQSFSVNYGDPVLAQGDIIPKREWMRAAGAETDSYTMAKIINYLKGAPQIFGDFSMAKFPTVGEGGVVRLVKLIVSFKPLETRTYTEVTAKAGALDSEKFFVASESILWDDSSKAAQVLASIYSAMRVAAPQFVPYITFLTRTAITGASAGGALLCAMLDLPSSVPVTGVLNFNGIFKTPDKAMIKWEGAKKAGLSMVVLESADQPLTSDTQAIIGPGDLLLSGYNDGLTKVTDQGFVLGWSPRLYTVQNVSQLAIALFSATFNSLGGPYTKSADNVALRQEQAVIRAKMNAPGLSIPGEGEATKKSRLDKVLHFVDGGSMTWGEAIKRFNIDQNLSAQRQNEAIVAAYNAARNVKKAKKGQGASAKMRKALRNKAPVIAYARMKGDITPENANKIIAKLAEVAASKKPLDTTNPQMIKLVEFVSKLNAKYANSPGYAQYLQKNLNSEGKRKVPRPIAFKKVTQQGPSPVIDFGDSESEGEMDVEEDDDEGEYEDEFGIGEVVIPASTQTTTTVAEDFDFDNM